jgi:phosphoadenosine phosphosulfate reductase
MNTTPTSSALPWLQGDDPSSSTAGASAIGLYARYQAGFEERLQNTLAILQTAAQQHPNTIIQATSLGAEDMVITDLIAKHALPIAIGTLETGALHTETLTLMQQIEQHYSSQQIQLEIYRPPADAVIQFVTVHGPEAMYQSIELRKACCGMRKLEPLSRMLKGRTAWVTGLRREQSAARGDAATHETDDQGRSKINPLIEWSWADVWYYIQQNNTPYSSLHDQFMPSIGCAPCSRAIAVGEPFRSGRWWWEEEPAKECGLHVKSTPNA